jgi:hypothetical protein
MIGHILLKKEYRRKREKGSDKSNKSKTDKNNFSSGSSTTETTTDISTSLLPNSVNQNEPTVAKELQKTTFGGDLSTDKILDQAKENVDRSAAEAKTEILRYKDLIQSYQEQNILYAEEIADSYISIQKLVINLLKLWWLPYWQSASLDGISVDIS